MRVAIAEDSGFFREALADALTSVGAEVVLKTDNVDDLTRGLASAAPDVVLLDICLPPTKTDEGLVAAEQYGVSHPEIGVLVLSAHLGMPHVARLLNTGRSGIGCLSKDQLHDTSVLLSALNRVAAGGIFVDPEFVEGRFRLDNLRSSLTPRENEILRAVARGLSNQAIADDLFINVKTVESAITSIFRKLNIDGENTNARVCAVLTFLGQSSGRPIR